MKFSGKICFKIVLKVTKKQGFILSLEDTFFEKPQGGVKLTPSAILRLKSFQLAQTLPLIPGSINNASLYAKQISASNTF